MLVGGGTNQLSVNANPGFLEGQRALAGKAAKTRPLHLRLEDWICDNIFDLARQEGWFFAVTYYAVRDPRYRERKFAGQNA